MSEPNNGILLGSQHSEFDTGFYRNPIPGVDNWQPPVPLLRQDSDPSPPPPPPPPFRAYFQDALPTVSWLCSCPLCTSSVKTFMSAIRNAGALYSANIATSGSVYNDVLTSVLNEANNANAAVYNRANSGTPDDSGNSSAASGLEEMAPNTAAGVPTEGRAGCDDEDDALTKTGNSSIGNDDDNGGVGGNSVVSGLMNEHANPEPPPYFYYSPSIYYNNPFMPYPTPYFNGSYYWGVPSGGNYSMDAPNRYPSSPPYCYPENFGFNPHEDNHYHGMVPMGYGDGMGNNAEFYAPPGAGQCRETGESDSDLSF